MLFNIYMKKHATAAEGITYSTQGLANGCYPNCWSLVSMRQVFGFMRKNAQYYDFLRTVPTRFAIMPRCIRLDAGQRRAADDMKRTGQSKHEQLLPSYVGMYSAVTRGGLPLVTVDRHDFQRRLDGYKVLCLANEACMSDEQVEAVRRFVRSGGGLVATNQTSLYDENGLKRKDFALADIFGVHSRVIKKTQTSEIIRLENPHTVVDDVVQNRFGSGRVVYIPGQLDAEQCQVLCSQTERLFQDAVSWAAGGELPVRIKASAPIATTLFDQKDRRILHLVNLNGDSKYQNDKIEPVENVNVELLLPEGRRLNQLHRLWDEGKVDFKNAGRRISLKLDRIGTYEVVVAELEPIK